MEYSEWIFGGAMLNYFRERQEALGATPGRRIYNYASGAVILVVMALVFAVLAPAWIFWIAFAVSCVLDVFLTRKWIREDALRAYRAGQHQ
ncbi:hypothetical protein ACQCSU_03210 [Pseudarthrobacter sp. O4]|uniref:hypothetical protein n=1 Tax=Pseudarthrobacter sp. O4 TaxID=3418417 RepID=UPI003CF83E41